MKKKIQKLIVIAAVALNAAIAQAVVISSQFEFTDFHQIIDLPYSNQSIGHVDSSGAYTIRAEFVVSGSQPQTIRYIYLQPRVCNPVLTPGTYTQQCFDVNSNTSFFTNACARNSTGLTMNLRDSAGNLISQPNFFGDKAVYGNNAQSPDTNGWCRYSSQGAVPGGSGTQLGAVLNPGLYYIDFPMWDASRTLVGLTTDSGANTSFIASGSILSFNRNTNFVGKPLLYIVSDDTDPLPGAPVPVSPPVDECSLDNITGCLTYFGNLLYETFSSLFTFLFVPTDITTSSFISLKNTAAQHLPFSFVFDMPTLYSELFPDVAGNFAITINFYGQPMTLLSSQLLQQSTIVQTVRTLLNSFLYLLTAFALYRIGIKFTQHL